MTQPAEDTKALVKGIVSEAQRLGLIWGLRPATVNAGKVPGAFTITYDGDGDGEPIPAVSWIGPLPAGFRVWAVSIPPGGTYVVGILNDGFHAVGTSGEPAFNTNWANTGAGFGAVGFRRTPHGQTELTGLASLTGTTNPAATIFTLPAGYRPNANRAFPASNNPSATTAGTLRAVLVLSTGEVQVTNFANATNPGVISLDGMIFPIDTDI